MKQIHIKYEIKWDEVPNSLKAEQCYICTAGFLGWVWLLMDLVWFFNATGGARLEEGSMMSIWSCSEVQSWVKPVLRIE